MNPGDWEMLKQFPIVAIFLIVVFRLQKDNRDYLDQRDKVHAATSNAMAESLRLMSDRVYGLGLAFVALAGENDPHKGAMAAKKIMEDLARDSVSRGHGREAGMGYGD
jgi:hypothetical protein